MAGKTGVKKNILHQLNEEDALAVVLLLPQYFLCWSSFYAMQGLVA